jgi:hypothetical protein
MNPSSPELLVLLQFARAFPAGPSLITPEEDRMVEDHSTADVREKLHREDLEDDLLKAVETASDAAWRRR